MLLVVLGAVFAFPAAAKAAPGDIGYEGPSSTGAGSATTGSKPESKLWWNDGLWWASMWDTGSSDFHIFKLNQGTQTWTDTGVALDDRASTRADALWDPVAGKLYVASHRFSESPASGYPGRLYRYSYNALTDTYTRDPGFPVTINNFRTETLVIDKDSSGQLWATWVQGGKVWVNTSVCNPTCNDASWGTAFSINPTNVNSDDISSVIAFGGNKIGVMWSNQAASADYFAVHSDSAADNVWTIETALSGAGMADDHINLKTDSSGRVYAAVKTSKSGSSNPLTMLLVRSPTGSWSSHVFGLVSNKHTRPIVLLDEANGLVRMFATSPESSTGGVQTIYQKTSPIGSISFAGGLGTPIITDADSDVNNVTSTKQNLTASTNLVVLASSSAGRYFHNFVSLGGGGGGQPPVASFTAVPSSGTAPLTVQFTDTSTGTVDSRAWDFQDDGVVDSTAANPAFTYTSPGTFTARLTVSNTAGPSSTTRTITVNPSGGGGGGSTLTFVPTDDAYVRSNFPAENTGADPTVRVYKSGSTETHSYLKFTVAGVTGPVSSVKLRLWVTDASAVSGSIYAVSDNLWSEGAITWATKPAPGAFIAAGGAATLGTWVEYDLTGAVAGDRTYSFVLKDGASDVARFSSEEGANDPQLVVTFGS
ncbi:MAG TPA: DNRLRE domain-containing protein [Gaiellaceae bacterium]